MHLILLSGGSGRRLWPLSNGVRSKQFLKVLRAENGGMESMVERVCRQLKGTNDIQWDSVTVVAGAAQRDQLMMHLPKEVGVIIEPERRDTFPAIAYAVSQLFHADTIKKDDCIAIMPVDPFVELSFFDTIALVEREIATSHADIVLIGKKPDEPTEKYGYILVDNTSEQSAALKSLPVKGFKEKPSVLEAQDLINRGALWNCGVFGMKASYVLDFIATKYAIRKFNPEYMSNVFATLPKISFDYEVVETAVNVRVLEYCGSWKDLGTWGSLTEEIAELSIGNVIRDDTCSQTHVYNELDIPIVALGVVDFVIVASNDGILVSSKGETSRLKEVMSESDIRPMHEKKRWGEYRVLSCTETDGGSALTKELLIKAGKQISYQVHNHRKEIWTIISGEGVLYLEGEKKKLASGDTITIGRGYKHGIHALTDLTILEIQLGTPLIEEDIIRIEMEWNPEYSSDPSTIMGANL